MATINVDEKVGIPLFIFNAGLIEETTSFVTIGSTTNPTYGTGATMYRQTYREGRFAVVRYEFSQLAGGSAGSGTYLLPLMSGLAIDYTKENVVGVGASATGNVGYGQMLANSVTYIAIPYSVNTGVFVNRIAINLISDTLNTDFSSTGAGFSANPLRFSITVRVPIVGWDLTEYVAVGSGFSTLLTPGLVRQSPQINIAAQVSCAQAGFAVNRAVAVVYQDVNAVFRLRFNLYGAFTAASISALTVTIAGVTSAATVQAVAGLFAGNSNLPPGRHFSDTSAGTFTSQMASANLVSGIILSGDIELASKPSWA